MSHPEPGTVIDGFELGECLHHGSMAWIYRVRYANGAPDPGFPMVMKIPRMSAGDGAENIVGFEVEQQILQVLDSRYVPRLVAVGDLARAPYLVMEYIPGQVLEAWLAQSQSPCVADVVALGTALAEAVHDLHQHNVVHLDLKPANVLVRERGDIALLDFGLSWHAHYPDLLAEQLRPAVGSPAWIAPEQVVGVRGDPRSDVFAIGVMLYQLLTGELPFGAPVTRGGLRQRLWMSPRPLRALRVDVPAWLQEVVLRCLEPEAALRYPSAAHLAFDLQNPTQVRVTARGEAQHAAGFWFHFKRWVRAAGMHYQPSPLPERQISEVPIVMVAVPHRDVSDATLYSLRQAAARSLGTRPGARLACVTVISSGQISTVREHSSETTVHRQYLAQLKQWAQPLEQVGLQWSCHVLESTDVAQALVDYARGNHVSVIVIGAATHGLTMQRLVATVPIKVAMEAPCTVVLVKQALPFEQLAEPAPQDAVKTGSTS
jgi:nucleotide-binding universal stress UspA family protein/predicted Ser/Thr protein kinase